MAAEAGCLYPPGILDSDPEWIRFGKIKVINQIDKKHLMELTQIHQMVFKEIVDQGKGQDTDYHGDSHIKRKTADGDAQGSSGRGGVFSLR